MLLKQQNKKNKRIIGVKETLGIARELMPELIKDLVKLEPKLHNM
jgi:hypothetical protein